MTAATLIIMTAAIYNWFVTPHTQYLMAEQKYQQTISSLEAKTKILTAKLQASGKKLQNLSCQYEQIKEAFFTIEDARQFLSGIQAAAEKEQCLIENLKFIPPRHIPLGADSDIEISCYQTNLKLTGSYGNIVKFLNILQNRPQKVQVDSMEISINSENGCLNCGLTLSIYTLKDKEHIKNVKVK